VVQPPRRLHPAAVVAGPRRPSRARDRAGGDGEQKTRGDEHEHLTESAMRRLLVLRARGWVSPTGSAGGAARHVSPPPAHRRVHCVRRVGLRLRRRRCSRTPGASCSAPDPPRNPPARVSRWSGLCTARWCGSFEGTYSRGEASPPLPDMSVTALGLPPVAAGSSGGTTRKKRDQPDDREDHRDDEQPVHGKADTECDDRKQGQQNE